MYVYYCTNCPDTPLQYLYGTSTGTCTALGPRQLHSTHMRVEHVHGKIVSCERKLHSHSAIPARH